MTSLLQRHAIGEWIARAVIAGVTIDAACQFIGISSRTYQRWRSEDSPKEDQRPLRNIDAVNQLTQAEKEVVLVTINADEFANLSPSQIVPILADRGQYLCSESTMYRLMKSTHQLAHRRAERPAKKRHKPRALTATEPNMIYSWDITYLSTTVKGQYYYLYMVMDVFSRKIVGWQVYDKECAQYASDLMKDICQREKIRAGQVVLHSDNGASMKASTMLATLQSLGVATSFSRPAVSNDNPYSEALFKTLKYRHDHVLNAFETLFEARTSVTKLVHWYNNEHRHSSIQFVTPEQRHTLNDIDLLKRRDVLYQNAKLQNPERWPGETRNWKRKNVVYLNPEKENKMEETQRNEQKLAA